MATIEYLIAIVQNLRASSYTCAAGVIVLLYDMILTTPAEVALIWPARFSLVKLLYFIVSQSISKTEWNRSVTANLLPLDK